MKDFLQNVWGFLKEIFMFGVDAFMVAAAREVGKRFWRRLKAKGGAIAALDEPKHDGGGMYSSMSSSGSQSRLPFLEEYRD
jgi:hypothetical protein